MKMSRETCFTPLLQIGALLCAAVAPGSVCAAETQPLRDWLLPNLASRLTVKVSNSNAAEPLDSLATVPLAEAHNAAPGFPGRLALALLIRDDKAQPAEFLPSQSVDLDADGVPDHYVFPVKLPPGGQARVDIYFSNALSDTFTWPQKVWAKHTYGYNRQVAALESELMGYRMYGGFFLDMQARLAGRSGLLNDVTAYTPPSLNLGTGRDVFHIGATLGIGGVFLRRNGVVYQPPMNVPDYAHKPSPSMVPRFRVVAQGPLRAIVEATLDRWNIADDVFQLKAVYSIDQGQPFVKCRVEVVPLTLQDGHTYDVGAGVRDLPNQESVTVPGGFGAVGAQNARDGKIGIAIAYPEGNFSPVTAVATADGSNHAVFVKGGLAPGRSASFQYAGIGLWSGSGITNLPAALRKFISQQGQKAVVSGLKFTATPQPEKVDAEAQ